MGRKFNRFVIFRVIDYAENFFAAHVRHLHSFVEEASASLVICHVALVLALDVSAFINFALAHGMIQL